MAIAKIITEELKEYSYHLGIVDALCKIPLIPFEPESGDGEVGYCRHEQKTGNERPHSQIKEVFRGQHEAHNLPVKYQIVSGYC